MMSPIPETEVWQGPFLYHDHYAYFHIDSGTWWMRRTADPNKMMVQEWWCYDGKKYTKHCHFVRSMEEGEICDTCGYTVPRPLIPPGMMMKKK